MIADEPTLDYGGLKRLAAELGRPVSTLIALSPDNDPFYAGTPTRLARAEWFASLWQKLDIGRGVHVRRLHYLLISQAKPPKTRLGKPYENSDECWAALSDASKDARYLDFVPADYFVDRRNDDPIIRLDPWNFKADIATEVVFDDPALSFPSKPDLPRLDLQFDAPQVTQRYHVELWCEKTTVNDVLVPLAQDYKLNVVTGSGELSITSCVNVVERARQSGRPVRILYVSDFDPGGMSMPVAVARKIEHRLYQLDLNLDIQVRPVVLTADQVAEYALPRIPLKETERRAASFEARHGEGAVELDALEALHPGELRRILTREIERYYDRDLAHRVQSMAEEIENELQAGVDEITYRVHERHQESINALTADWEEISARIREWQARARPVWQGIAEDLQDEAPEPDADDYKWPEPDEGDEDDDPLFDSTRSYVEQMDRSNGTRVSRLNAGSATALRHDQERTGKSPRRSSPHPNRRPVCAEANRNDSVACHARAEPLSTAGTRAHRDRASRPWWRRQRQAAGPL